VAREYGVSRRWVHELVARYDAEGETGLVPRSRRPRHSPSRTVVEVEEAIVAWRKRLSEEGLDAGAATIAVHLSGELGSAREAGACGANGYEHGGLGDEVAGPDGCRWE
jgi:hypothetical protein